MTTDPSPLAALRRRAVRMILTLLWLQVPLVPAVAWAVDAPWLWPMVLTVLVAGLAEVAGLGDRASLRARMVPSVGFVVVISILVGVLSGHKFQVDAHMYYFAALALLVAFCDWRVILAAAATVAVHHAVLNILVPDLVYPGGGDLLRLLLHAVVVVIEAGALMAIAASVERMVGTVQQRVVEVEAARDAAQRSAQAAEDAARDAAEARRAADLLRDVTSEEDSRILSTLGTTLRHLAAGDLASGMGRDLPSKAARLSVDYDAAVTGLGAALTQVARTSAAIRSNADAIAQAADGLSQRTERQGANLAETVSALEAVTSGAGETSRSAAAMKRLAVETRAEVERSNGVVGEAVAAMAVIEASAREIAQIIGVIDEIAFQTNLLALNAGVEAARAGDSGRGFAVVAAEVRALAHRSAEAAKEIKTLISTSGQQVATGVGLVRRTGTALDTIVARVGDLQALTDVIAVAAESQSGGLAEVTAAVGEADLVTQRNAAMAEETSAEIHTLVEQADKLLRLVDRFRLGDPVPAPPRGTPMLKLVSHR